MNTKEASAILRLTPRQIVNLASAGTIKGAKPGRDWNLSRASVMAYASTAHPPGPKRKA